MRFDIEDQLSVDQLFNASAVSTNARKKKTAAQDISIGRRMALLVCPKVAGAGGASWALQAIQADDAALTSNVSVMSQVTVADADLVVGNEIEIPIPQGVMDQQYIGFRAVPTGGAGPTVTLNVYLVPQDEIAKYKSFPKVVDADVAP